MAKLIAITDNQATRTLKCGAWVCFSNFSDRI